MCRLLGVVTREPTPLLESVPEELPLFTALSEKHKDGWGAAWYRDAAGGDGQELEIRRGIDTARASTEYGQAVADAAGEAVIVHLRRASAGLALALANTHPFREGAVAFAHNGQFDLPEGLRERILARGGRPPAGTTDSELYFSLITLHAREHGWAEAVQLAAADLAVMVPEMGGRRPEGLNCLLLTPHELVAYAQCDPDQLEAASTWDTYDLRCRADAGRVVVASSGYAQDGYETIRQGQAVTIARESLEVRVHEPVDGFRIAPAHLDGEEAWAARRPGAPGAQASLAAAGAMPAS